jgi:hypothetical protein
LNTVTVSEVSEGSSLEEEDSRWRVCRKTGMSTKSKVATMNVAPVVWPEGKEKELWMGEGRSRWKASFIESTSQGSPKPARGEILGIQTVAKVTRT